MQLDGKNILMVGPGFNEFGEHFYSSNEQFGMYRAAAWLKATGRNVTFVDGALPVFIPGFRKGKSRLKEAYPRAPIVREAVCGNGESDFTMTKALRYYGKPYDVIKSSMLKAPRPDEVWVGTGLTYHYETSWELVQMAQELFPGVRVRMGGIYPTLCPEHARGSGADVWVGDIPESKDFWPDYSVIDYMTPQRTIKFNTGCTVTKACSFCAVKTFEPRFTFRAPESLETYVESEIRKGVRVFRIWASQLLQPPQAFAESMDRLYAIQLKYGIRLRLFASEGIQPSLFTPDMAGRMVRAGFSHITIPMESVNPETLLAYNKPSNLSDYHRSVHLAKEAGFSWIGAFIMTGTPQQTLDELVHAVVDCWYRRISPVIMKYTMIPGTQDWDTPEYQWIHRGKDLVDLHGSLWPAARPELTSLDLEEVTAIAAYGYELWASLPQSTSPHYRGEWVKTSSRVNETFVKWCEFYGLRKNGVFRRIGECTPHEPCNGVESVSDDTIGASVGHASVSLVV